MKKNWSDADEKGMINIPDEFDPLFNKVGMQIRFHTISGKNEIQTICHIMEICQDFFRKNPEYLNKGKEQQAASI